MSSEPRHVRTSANAAASDAPHYAFRDILKEWAA